MDAKHGDVRTTNDAYLGAGGSRRSAAAGSDCAAVPASQARPERGLLKHARIAGSINAALRERGADKLTARLGADVGMLAFAIAMERWMQGNDDEPFRLQAAAALTDLQVRAAGLDSSAPGSPARPFRG